MLPEPQLISNIGASDPARQHVGASYTISGSNKRKRSEVVLGTDSSGVEIFDIKSRNSRSLTSHGVPPGDAFVCSPVSVVVKHGSRRSQERFTYWASHDSQRARNKNQKLNKVKITCLHEADDGTNLTSTIIGSAQEPTSPIKTLDIIPSNAAHGTKDSTSHNLIALHEDATLNAYSADLQASQLTTQLAVNQSRSTSIQYATTVSLPEARESFLSAREDVLASLPGEDGDILVCVETASISELSIAYFNLAPRPTLLFRLHLPSPHNTDKRQFWLHPKSSKLYELRQDISCSHLSIYDLSGLSIRLESSINIPAAHHFARISPYTVAVGLKDSLATYDVKWNYLQDSIPTRSSEGSSQVQPLSYFSATGTLVALDGDALVSYNLRDDADVNGRAQKRRRTGGLADAVGRGTVGENGSIQPGQRHMISESLGKRLMPSESSTASTIIKKRFDHLLNDAESEEYDADMLRVLQTVSGSKKGASIGYAAQPELVAYAVCGLFDVENTHEVSGTARLKVRRMAPETFRFLLTHGLLTLSQVERSLQIEGRLDRQDRLEEASIVQALTEHDDTLQALIYYLSSAPLLSAHELSAALLVCLKTVQRLASKSSTKAIEGAATTNSESLTNGDVPMTNGANGLHEDEEGFDGEWPDPDPEEGLTHNARSALGSCLTRLSLCNDKDVQKALRATMSADEILVLVDYIRMELSSGGWLARYLDEDLQGESDLSAQTNQVNVAAKILNCAIDSLGAATWLLGSGSGSELDTSRSADKVTYMQAEINAALEGIENSAFLQNILHEVLLYAKSAEEADQPSVNADIVAVPVGAEGKEAQMLPLGMKKDKISRTRVAAGGKEVPRSARDIGRLESKKVPEYSFERIMI